jgi:cellulose synthase/poly-beta-1,6-N-acetylglucosamine synthase-like glycosyltransferase
VAGQCEGTPIAAKQRMFGVVFWVAVCCVLHTYVIYPLLLVALDAVAQARSAWGYLGGNERRRPLAQLGLPSVSVLIAAYDEQGCIARRIENLLAQDYPGDKLEILIGSDGSTDETDAIVQRYAARGVKLSRAERCGKAGVLSRLVALAKGDVLVMTDANTEFERDAIRHLIQPLRDDDVGLVCGRLRLHSPAGAPLAEGAYWKLESLLKLYESRRGCVMGANGGIYAVRKDLFPPLPAGTVVDDFVAALRVLAAGARVCYEPEAVAHEEAAPDHANEYRRRVRIAAGGFRALSQHRDLLSPRHGFTAFALWSHKVLRWFVPHALVLAMIANVFLAGVSPFYSLALLVQLATYALATVSLLGMTPRHVRAVADAAAHFVEMNAALLVGFVKYSRGGQGQTWVRTDRPARAA